MVAVRASLYAGSVPFLFEFTNIIVLGKLLFIVCVVILKCLYLILVFSPSFKGFDLSISILVSVFNFEVLKPPIFQKKFNFSISVTKAIKF